MRARHFVWMVAPVFLVAMSCGGNGNKDGGDTEDAGNDAGNDAGTGLCGADFGPFPAIDCETDIPDLSAYSVGDFYEVPLTATDDCDATFSDTGSKTPANALNVILDGADPGDIICIAAGTYTMEGTVTIAAVPGLTLKGTGTSPDDTVLNYGGPGTGKGILVQQDNVTIENLRVTNTGDNGVQQEEVTGSVFRKLHVSWDINEDMSDNGAYGIYPTDCEDTLVEYCQLQGAADAGIYVGKCGYGKGSPGAGTVRYNVVHQNVLGLEVENSKGAIVHDNTMVNNTAGLLSLQQPLPGNSDPNADLAWYDNDIYCNNFPNFAAGGVAEIAPPGIGALVYSGADQDIYCNNIQNNDTGGVLIISNYLVCQFDGETDCNRPKGYIPYPINIYVHDNYYAGNGTNPGQPFTQLIQALGVGTPQNPAENVLWDGYIWPDVTDPGICLGEDNTASYRDMSQNLCQDVESANQAALGICAANNTTTSTAGRLCTPDS